MPGLGSTTTLHLWPWEDGGETEEPEYKLTHEQLISEARAGNVRAGKYFAEAPGTGSPSQNDAEYTVTVRKDGETEVAQYP